MPAEVPKPTEGGVHIRVALPYALLEYTRGHSTVELVAADLADAIAKLNARFPGLAYRILDDQGRLRRHVLAFVNEEGVSHVRPGEVRLREGDVVTILPSIAGG